MARAPVKFQRVSRGFAPQPTVLVICEDSKSGKRYLEDATRHFRVNVTVEVSHCGHTDPLGIVADAVARQRGFDKVFCVIDRDTHPNFDQALALAAMHQKLTIIASYPCFEFWYLLHFRYTSRTYVTAGDRSPGQQVVRALRICPNMEGYDKGGDVNLFEELLPLLADAQRNSERLLAESIQANQPDPSTTVHKLIAEFQILTVPQPIRR